MPWKTKNQQEQRYDLVRAIKTARESITELSRRWRVSRKMAYKWLKRYRRRGLQGLLDESRKPERMTRRTTRSWLDRLRRRRRRHPTWGARKLHHRLRQESPGMGLPAVVTVSRWLKRWGLAKGRPRRRVGPMILRPKARPAQKANQIWTVDFKGSYCTGNGTRVDPLTVRDLYSRYEWRWCCCRIQSIQLTGLEFVKIFREYGLPARIRCDNGTPFGEAGPTGLTRLSAWWVKLGIKVEHITPGRPCEQRSPRAISSGI